MTINIIAEFRKAYIQQRRKKLDQDSARSAALNTVQLQILHASAAYSKAVSKKDIALLEDLIKNPHYTQLLEDIIGMPEDQQREYLRTVAAAPKLRLISSN